LCVREWDEAHPERKEMTRLITSAEKLAEGVEIGLFCEGTAWVKEVKRCCHTTGSRV